MELKFDISGDPLCLANIRACAAASRLVYDAPNITGKNGETALIQECGDCLVIAFPGTHDIHDILDDVDALRREMLINAQPCSVHKGFDDAHDNIFPAVRAWLGDNFWRNIFMTGHSKGAAVAKRCALALDCGRAATTAVITFGEPRGGDRRYAAIYNGVLGQRTLRLTNAADPVPWLPGWLAGNRHCGPEAFMPPGENKVVDGPNLWWKVVRNGGEILRGFRAIEEFRDNPLTALQILQSGNPIKDHFIDNYLGRLNALA